MAPMKECVLYEPLPQGNLKCNLCQVRCTVRPGKAGFCNTRLNRDGKLWTLIYGVTSAVAVDPIEKKPINHAYPGTKILLMESKKRVETACAGKLQETPIRHCRECGDPCSGDLCQLCRLRPSLGRGGR